MLYAPISPISMSEAITRLSSYLMTLPTMAMSSQGYADLYRSVTENGAFVMMDNGVSELKTPFDVEELLPIIEELQPSEVILPDFLKEGERTCRSAKASASWLRQMGYGGRLMAVPQGKTVDEYLACVYSFVAMREINTIGISKYFPSITGEPRRTLLSLIRDRGLHNRRSLDWHLLGLSESMYDLSKLALDFPWMRGIDSCFPVLAAMKGVQLNADQREIFTSPEGFERADPWAYWPEVLKDDRPSLTLYLEYNVAFFTEVCRGRVV